ncbi:hypothetical protein DV736_g4014, partial [Chaetothyriales sp. CBS 134916]
MALRERLRRTFRSKKSGSSDGYPPRRTDIEYYKPHEIPKSKYKGKVDPAHKERLEAYSFADAFEKASSTGTTGSNVTSATSAGSIDDQIASVASAGGPKEARLGESDENESRRIDNELSRTVTTTDELSTAEGQDVAKLWMEKTITQGKPYSEPQKTLFSAEELERAMTRATLRPRRGTVIGHLEEVVP